MYGTSINNINDEQNNVCTGINPFQILFQFASSLSPMNAEIPALISFKGK